MEYPLITVIVPIYNAEKTLDKCIKSIINQSYKNLEIILIDDGSKDNSLDICNRYKEIDNRIVVIHKSNSGVSATRNYGLNIMHGNFVGFVDSDDSIDKDMYMLLYKSIKENNADVSICNFYNCFNNQNEKNDYKQKCTYIGIKECLSGLLEKQIGWTNWNKLYSKEIIGDFRFKEDLHVGEDGTFNLDICTSKKDIKFSFIDYYLYYYLLDDSSGKYNKRINDYFEFWEEIIERLDMYSVNSYYFKVEYICKLRKYIYLQRKNNDNIISDVKDKIIKSKKYKKSLSLLNLNIKFISKLLLSKILVSVYSKVSD